jgi:tetratricopeptide (TPR) repeat protein
MSEDNKPWHWNPTLPGLLDELVLKIFSFCSTEKLVICSMVCKRWRKLVTHPSLRLHRRIYFLALAQLDREDFVAAMKVLDGLLALFPTDAKAHRKKNECYMSVNFGMNTFKAFYELTLALQCCKKLSYSYLIRSDIYCMADNFEKSMNEVNTAIKINPVNPIYLHQRGYIVSALAKTPQDKEIEVRDYEEVMRRPYKRIAMVYNNVAYCYFLKEQDDLAFKYYEKAIELCPYFCKAFLNRALLHYHRGSIESALQDCEKAAQINPEFYEVYSFRGACHLRLGRIKLAGSDFHKAFHLCYGLDHLVIATFYSYLHGAGLIEQIIDEANELIPYYQKYISYITECINITKRRIEELDKRTNTANEVSFSSNLPQNNNEDVTLPTSDTNRTGSETNVMSGSLNHSFAMTNNALVKNGELYNPPLINYTIDEFQRELLHILTKDLRRARHLLNLSLQRRAEAKIFLGLFESAREDFKILQQNITLDQNSAESRHAALRQTMFLETFFSNIDPTLISQDVLEVTKMMMKTSYLNFDEQWNFGHALTNFTLRSENDIKYFILLYRKKIYGIVDPFREHCLDFSIVTRRSLEAYFKQRIPQFREIGATNLCQDFLSWTWHDNNQGNNNQWNIAEFNFLLMDENHNDDADMSSDENAIEVDEEVWPADNSDSEHNSTGPNERIDDIDN